MQKVDKTPLATAIAEKQDSLLTTSANTVVNSEFVFDGYPEISTIKDNTHKRNVGKRVSPRV